MSFTTTKSSQPNGADAANNTIKESVFATVDTKEGADAKTAAAQTGCATWARVKEKLGVTVYSTHEMMGLYFTDSKSAIAWSEKTCNTFCAGTDAVVRVGRPTEPLVVDYPHFALPLGLYHILIYIWEQKVVFDPSSKQWTFHHFSKALAQTQADAWLTHFHL